VVLLSHRLWQRRFSGDPGIIGTAIRLNDVSCTVVGVMPASFRHPERGFKPDLISAFQLSPRVDWAVPRMGLTRVIGRLKPGVSLEQSQSDLAELSKRTNADVPAIQPNATVVVNLLTGEKGEIGTLTINHFLKVTVDPNHKLTETAAGNNSATIKGNFTSYPFPTKCGQ